MGVTPPPASQVMFHGAAGQSVAFFERRGFGFPAGGNPADWLLFLATTTPGAGIPPPTA